MEGWMTDLWGRTVSGRRNSNRVEKNGLTETSQSASTSPLKFPRRNRLQTVGIGGNALSPTGKPSTLGNASPNKFIVHEEQGYVDMDSPSSTPTKTLTMPRVLETARNSVELVVKDMSLEPKFEFAHLENAFCLSETTTGEDEDIIKLKEVKENSSPCSNVEKVFKDYDLPNMLKETQLKNEEIEILRQKLDEKENFIQELKKKATLDDTRFEKINSLQKAVREENSAASKRLRITQHSLQTKIESLEHQLQTFKDDNKQLKDDSSFYEKRLSDVYSYMQNLSLFGKDLGKFILEEIKTSQAPSTFQSHFTKFYPDIKDVKDPEIVEQCEQLKQRIYTLEKNDRIRLEKIISLFKLTSERLHFMQQQHGQKIECLQKEVSTKEQQFRLEKRRWHDVFNIKEENFQKLKNELKEKLILSEKVQRNAEDKLNEYMKEHEGIIGRLQSQSSVIENLNTQMEELDNTNKKMSEELMGKQDEAFKFEETIEFLKEEVLQEKLSLKELYGDASTELNFETVGKSFPHITKDKYDSLGLDILMDLTYVQSQNLIKNLLIVLDIPLKTFLKVVPTIVIQLRCELALLTRFANDLNLKVFGKQIDFKSRRKIAMNEFLNNHDIAEVKHPLNYDLQALLKYFFT
ncbi:hypothetical protein SEUBUCD646_0D00180 [Saccharomyces eubayanus]|uniref:Accumulation of dyads involved protein n=2 Tax=Saccharomyces TaxID=4930 RepID=A0A6C1E629_SACPS|nr:hypothetical protein GRS66_006474 [Saccharomyces pastorianus]CAI1884602.1 hypothetical protein SEUBUCD650_0D00170 [Saccharomyces eubayanus]CAI1918185.1 hypothetical protein SEUBUCD646_0D00180 [Saccharomyces eubayanus]